MARDCHAWHQEYDDPASSRARRLAGVRAASCRAREWRDAAGVRVARVRFDAGPA
jgi:hypothetical protein